MFKIPTYNPTIPPVWAPRVKDCRVYQVKGDWNSKSGGNLQVFCRIPWHEFKQFYQPLDPKIKELQAYLDYHAPGIAMRQFRVYEVKNIPLYEEKNLKSGIGGKEIHVHREELMIAVDGIISMELEDFWGEKNTVILKAGDFLWVRPFIKHSYQCLEAGSRLVVIANTALVPDLRVPDYPYTQGNPTYDTFDTEIFEQMRQKFNQFSPWKKFCGRLWHKIYCAYYGIK